MSQEQTGKELIKRGATRVATSKSYKPKKGFGWTVPRIHSPLLNGETKAAEVIDLAKRIGIDVLPWQEWVLNDMMKIDEKGKYKRKTVGLLIARQNGKTFLATLRILYGLLQGEKVMGMSAKREQALKTFEEVLEIILEHEWLVEMLAGKPRRANGQERIKFKNGGEYRIAAATRASVRGFSADLLYCDELREFPMEAWVAARPITRARPNAVTLISSNAGDAFSEVLNDLRTRALEEPHEKLGWYEYSAPAHCKIWDKNAWAMANPALGYLIDYDTLEESVATNTVEATRTEMLCQWVDSLASPFPPNSIENCIVPDLQVGAPTVFAMDVSPSKRQASLVGGQLMSNGKIAFGLMQVWTSDVGVDELQIADQIQGWAKKFYPQVILYDKYSTQSIAEKLQQSGCMVQDCSGMYFYQACSDLLDGFINQRLALSHQPELLDSFRNVAAKQRDEGWRIVRRKSAGDVTAAICSAMVVWQLNKPSTMPNIIFVE